MLTIQYLEILSNNFIVLKLLSLYKVGNQFH